MPKNKGKGGKNRRRGKNENESEKRELLFKEDEQEYAQVTKMLGNGRLEAMCFDGTKRLCHIRGKLRKKVKLIWSFESFLSARKTRTKISCWLFLFFSKMETFPENTLANVDCFPWWNHHKAFACMFDVLSLICKQIFRVMTKQPKKIRLEVKRKIQPKKKKTIKLKFIEIFCCSRCG